MSLQLPVLEILPALRKTLSEGNAAVLQAPPGAGKSTLVPLELLQEPWLKGRKILMLEPRRLAARGVAMRMAELLGEEVGETAGYRIRFENRCTARTRIEVLTEGILTRMLQQDNALEGVGLVIFDEFHERSLHADLAFALCREAQQILREDLRLLVMSATLDTDQVAALLGGAPTLRSEGRQHPVQLHYLPQDEHMPLPQRMVRGIRQAYTQFQGDILAFLPGSGEIIRTQSLLEEALPELLICPLYGELSHAEQQRAILPDPAGRRRVILSTSIAETSLTLEGVAVVVDSGQARVPRFDPRSGLTRLVTVDVTRDAADQRTGRAGRLGPGNCIRLWPEARQTQLQATRKPEILEADLCPLLLELAQWGVTQPQDLYWPTPPPAGALAQARELLTGLEALDTSGKITPRGQEMLRLPTHPRLAHMLLVSRDWKLEALAADLAALLEERDPLPRESGAGLPLRIETLQRWRSGERVQAERSLLDRIERLSRQWRQLLKAPQPVTRFSYEDCGRLIALAFPERVARRADAAGGRYRLSNGRMARIDAHDPLVHDEWLAIAHLDAGHSGEGRIFLAAPVAPADLQWMSRHTETVAWDSRNGVLIAQKEFRIGDLIAGTQALPQIPEDLRAAALCGALRSEGLSLLPWEDSSRQWQARVNSLRLWRPAESWPDVTDAGLLESLEAWLAPWLAQVRKRDDFRRLDLPGLLQAVLPWELGSRLESLAPEKIQVPSGSWIPLEYELNGAPPVLAVRLQECFGLLDTPTVNGGQQKIMMHLLSPGYKPVQVTQDLRSFWQNTYPEVRKELRMRYPKHAWPEDPWTAEAVRGVKKRT